VLSVYPALCRHGDLFIQGANVTRVTSSLFACAALLVAVPVAAEMSAKELAKILQDPIGNLISVPFQENLYSILDRKAAPRAC